MVRSYAGEPSCAPCAFCIQFAAFMDKTGIHPGGRPAHVDVRGPDEPQHEGLGWWRKYLSSTDHKVIGIQYAITGLLFLLIGFTLMMIMRWQLAYPGRPIPLIGQWLGQDRAPMGIMLPEFYNQLGAMHGTIMVFMGVVPLAVGGFGNFVMPLQIGAPDMAFPKINMASYWAYVLGGVTMITSFFMPSGLVLSGRPIPVSGNGNPLLWQHLFWFLAHPEVYVLILPAMGIVAEIIANNTRKPLWGYKAMVYSVTTLGFLSFIVWAHHMFMTGMGTTMSAFFQTTTMIISIPSVVILTSLLLSLWRASIRFTTPMLFALAFLPMFGIGGLTGLPLGLAPSDIHLHDTYYVIGHFHYVVAPGTIFALFAGVYHWFPKATGRKMNETLGKIHFWISFVAINFVFMPMFIQGLGGMNRRMYDGGMQYAHNAGLLKWNIVIGIAAWALGLAQLPFIVNFFGSIKWGPLVDKNPWEATTLEWSAPSPPGHGNFITEPVVYRGPYEYSVPGAAADLTPQFDPERA